MNRLIACALGAGLLAIGSSAGALAGGWDVFQEVVGGSDFPPVTNESYRAECGSCHLAFPPRLLTANGWRDLMGTLKNHFGDDVTLTPAVTKELLDYLLANAAKYNIADHSPIAANSPGAVAPPPRITATFFFTARHHALSKRGVKDNPKVGSFANCQACHPRADKGAFSDTEVAIPAITAVKI